MTIFYLLAGLPFLFGLALIALGVRGRRVDDHPWCRKCRFDLFGLTEPKTCPECGHELKKRGAIRTGQRQRSGGKIVFGLSIVAAALLGGGGWQFNRENGEVLNRHKPLWLLSLESQSSYDKQQIAAAGEIFIRFKGDSLNEAELASLVELALDLQANRELPWDTQWGDIVSTALAKGIATGDQELRYIRQIYVTKLVVRERVAHGRALPCVIDVLELRGSSQPNNYQLSGEINKATILVNGKELALPADSNEEFSRNPQISLDHWGGSYSRGRPRMQPDMLVSERGIINTIWFNPSNVDSYADIPPGEHRLRLEIEWFPMGSLTTNGDSMEDEDRSPERPPLGTDVFEATFTVLPAGTPSLKVIKDPSFVKSYKDPTWKPTLSLTERRDGRGNKHSEPDLVFPMRSPWMFGKATRGPMMYRIEAHAEGKKWELIKYASSDFDWSASYTHRSYEDIPDRVTIRCVPQIEYARNTIGIYEFVGDELVFEDVKVERRQAVRDPFDRGNFNQQPPE